MIVWFRSLEKLTFEDKYRDKDKPAFKTSSSTPGGVTIVNVKGKYRDRDRYLLYTIERQGQAKARKKNIEIEARTGTEIRTIRRIINESYLSFFVGSNKSLNGKQVRSLEIDPDRDGKVITSKQQERIRNGKICVEELSVY